MSADAGSGGRPIADPERVAEAGRLLEQADLSPAEASLAAGTVLVDALRKLHADASSLRTRHGDDAAAQFARRELNDLIAELQDILPLAVRTYNALLRDPDGAPPDKG